MKKLKWLCLSLACILSLAACGSDPSGSSVSSSAEPTPSMDQVSTQEQEPSSNLTQADAYQLVSEKARELSISTLDTVTVNGRTYYLFLIQDSITGISSSYAVDNQSGEISIYTEDGQIFDLSSSPFYQASLDGEYDWNGTFVRNTRDGRSLELMQGDPQSFEFVLNQPDSQEDGTLFGVAYIHGNLARFNDEEAGISLNFTVSEDNKTVTITGNEAYSGIYTLS